MTQYPDPVATNLSEGFVVAIRIVSKDGEADAVADILERLIAPTMAEEGVKFFMPDRSPDDPNAFFIFELYKDAAGWDAHNEPVHFLNAIEELLPSVEVRERVPFFPYVE